MAIYSTPNYRAGYEYYLKYRTLTNWLVGVDATVDPAEQSCTTLAGICPVPNWTANANLRPVQGIGSGRDLGYVPGRQEYSVGVRLDVADPTFLTYAFRYHATPGALYGMTPLVCRWGPCAEYAKAGGYNYTHEAGDCLINTLRLEVSENANLTADLDLWPLYIKERSDSAGLSSAVPSGAAAIPIVWQSIEVGSSTGGVITTDYRSIIARVSLSLSNNLQRVGARKLLCDNSGVEQAISRTPYRIRPAMEQLQVAYTLHDEVPPGWDSIWDHGQVTLYGEGIGYGPGRHWLRITIDHNYLNRKAGNQTPANGLVQYTAEMSARAVTFATGVTA